MFLHLVLEQKHTCPIYTSRYDSSNRKSIGTNGTIGTNRKGCHSSGSIGEYASHQGDLDYFRLWPGLLEGNSYGPLVPMVRLVPKKILHVSLLINRQVAHEQKRDISFLVIKKIHQDFQSSQNMFIIRWQPSSPTNKFLGFRQQNVNCN